MKYQNLGDLLRNNKCPKDKKTYAYSYTQY